MSPGDHRFPPIAGYGFLSDCHTGALVSFDGSVEWLCLPRFDSPSVFGAMLDRDAGHFTVRAHAASSCRSAAATIPGTLVIETTWVTDTGWMVVHDALSIAAWADGEPGHADRLRTSPTSRCCGRSTASTATSSVEIECRPRFDYGAARRRVERPAAATAIAAGAGRHRDR